MVIGIREAVDPPKGSADGLANSAGPLPGRAGPRVGKGLRGSVVKEIIDFPGFEAKR